MKVTNRPALNPIADASNVAAGKVAKTDTLRGGNRHTDRLTADLWAQGCIALCVQSAQDWTVKAHQLFGFTPEQRAAAIKAFRQWKSAKVKARKEGAETAPAMDDKTFKRVMGTATVRISHLSSIANAIDAGMDHTAIAAHFKCRVEQVPNLSIDSLYSLAKTYGGSNAGRTVETLAVALGKWLDKRESDGRILPADEDLLAAIRNLI